MKMKNVLSLVLALVLMFTLASAALAMGPPPGGDAGGPPPDAAGGAPAGGDAPGGAAPAGADTPNTGDSAMTAVWALLAGVSLCGLAAVVVEKKVRSNH